MFILRSYEITDEPKCTERNQIIGDEYSLISKEDKQQFDPAFKYLWNIDKLEDQPFPGDYYEETFAIIHVVINGVGKYIPLYKKFMYYVMTDSGRTFTSIRFK